MNNLQTDMSINRDGDTLDYCRLHDITIQAWSPLQHGFFQWTFVDNPDFPELNEALAKFAEREGVAKAAIALAWLLRHPTKMHVIIGSINPKYIQEAAEASHHD